MSEPPKYATELIAVKAERDALKIACAERDKEIERLRQVFDVSRLTVIAQDERISTLEALLERVPHKGGSGWTGGKFDWICHTDCPRCAFEKLKQQPQ